jgi:hypothetical protein
MKKIFLIGLTLVLIFSLAGCEKKMTSEDLIGTWNIVGIECEEEDIKNDVLSGNIKVVLEITATEMTISANGYQDPPLKYSFDGETFVFDADNVVGGIEEEKLTLDLVIDDHMYSYLFEKVK